MASLLVRGGLGIHYINIADHLYYDPSASPKHYLTYSESQWRFWRENDVQYINRIQRSDWMRMFTEAGFSLVEERGSYADLTGCGLTPGIRVSAERTSNVRTSIWSFGRLRTSTVGATGYKLSSDVP